jgi:ATP-dependent helicase/nuclease subunit A
MSEMRTNIVVTASAGTGKTYRLVSEFTDAVLGVEGTDPIHPRRILALTFTEKAAAEMKTRISARLSETEAPKSQKVRGYIRDLDQAHITTYHSFCAKILREYATQLDLDARFQLLDTFEESELATKIGKQVALRHLERGDPELLSLIARLQLSGVVEYLVRVREQLIESGLDPDRLPKSQSASPRELLLSSQLSQALRKCDEAFSSYDEILSTLSTAAQEKVKRAREAFGLLSGALADADLSTVEIRISSTYSTVRQALSGRFGPDAVRKELIGELTSLGTLLCSSFVSPEENAFRELLRDFWTELEAVKKRTMCLAFGDLLVLTRRALRENLALRKELKARFDRVLVDEYQDTSPIQEDIVTLLCENLDDEKALDKNEQALGNLRLAQGKLFVVGDPKQSIYGFRGSDVMLFKRMAEVIVEQAGSHESLNVSRRSSPSVVEVVNQAVPCDESEKLIALRESIGAAGALLKDADEPKALSLEIATLLREEVFQPKDIAILVRRIKKATPILQELTRLGIPARIWGGEGFFERQEVVELVSALHLAIDPNNSIAWLTVMRSPLIGFDDFCWASLFAALQDSKEGFTLKGISHAVNLKPFDDSLTQRFENFFATIESIVAQRASISAIEALERVLKTNAYKSFIGQDADANVQKLKGLLIESEGDFTTQIENLARKLRQAPKEALGEERLEPNAVRIMTIHQSKGLEFPVVFVADTSATIPSDNADLLFDDKLGLALSHRGRPIAVCAPEGEWADRYATPIQAVRTRQRAKNEAELSRLLYVALTRARDRIYVVDGREVDESGKSQHRGTTLLSLFLAHAPDALRHCERERSDPGPATSLCVEGNDAVPVILSESFAASSRPLLFASDLISTPSLKELRADRLVYQPRHSIETELSASERGSLAHKMIRMATEQMTVSEFEDQAITRQVLSAALRMLGCSEQHDDIINDCVATLEAVIYPLLKSEFTFQFEMPIRYETDEWVVKGFADAVATRGDIACIIDFKSSEHAARSEKTELQLLAYCAALRGSADRIFYSSCVIGESEALDFQPFDEEGLGKLEAHLRMK